MFERVSTLHTRDFRVIRIQATAFVSGEPVRSSTVMVEALNRWREVYNGQALSIPLPPEAPGQIPSVVLSSGDGTQRLEVAQERINLVWARQGSESADIAETFATFATRLADLRVVVAAGYGRLGAVVARTADHLRPGMSLAQHFCREALLGGPLNRPDGFEIHAHKVYPLLHDLQANSWVRVKTAKGGDANYRLVVVEQDINTLAENASTTQFSDSEISSFFSAAAGEFDSILRMYFPEAEPALEG